MNQKRLNIKSQKCRLQVQLNPVECPLLSRCPCLWCNMIHQINQYVNNNSEALNLYLKYIEKDNDKKRKNNIKSMMKEKEKQKQINHMTKMSVLINMNKMIR